MRWFSFLSCLILSAAAAPIALAQQPPDKIPSALAQTASLEFDDLTLDQCAERLQSLTKLNVIVHPSLRPLLDARDKKLWADVIFADPAAPKSDPPRDVDRARGFSCSLRYLPLHVALREFLEHYGLGYAVVGESLLIATSDRAQRMQRDQPVVANFDKVPLAQVIDDFRARHGIPLVLDGQAVRDPRVLVTLQVRDVSLEDAVHLLADQVNVKAAPLAAGWVLTSADKAREWEARARRRAEAATVKLRPALLGGGMGGATADASGLAVGIGGPALAALDLLESVDIPRALLEAAGPPARVGRVADKVAAAVPLLKAAEPRKSLAAETLRKMQEPFDFTEDNPLTLKDAIKVMEDMGCPRIVLRMQAFRDENPEAPNPLEAQVNWPVKGLSRAKTLRLLLDQTPTGNANFLVRPGHILITTNDSMRPNAQFIRDASFVKRPLDEALQELSELSGINIVIDPRVGERAKALVTARFPSETNVAQATRLLADMADLKAVMVDATMYVTSRSNTSVFPEEGISNGKYTKKEAAL